MYLTNFREAEVNIAEYSPRRSRGKFVAIFTDPEVENCFSTTLKENIENLKKIELSNHDKKSYNHHAHGDYNSFIIWQAILQSKSSVLIVSFRSGFYSMDHYHGNGSFWIVFSCSRSCTIQTAKTQEDKNRKGLELVQNK